MEADGYTFDAIGHVESCFAQRRGTPRQGSLVPAARARIKLRSTIPPSSLECLDQFSHVWVIFVFHENTNLAKAATSGKKATFPAKIAPPRCVCSVSCANPFIDADAIMTSWLTDWAARRLACSPHAHRTDQTRLGSRSRVLRASLGEKCRLSVLAVGLY